MSEILEILKSINRKLDLLLQREKILNEEPKVIAYQKVEEVKEGLCQVCGEPTGAKWKKLCLDHWKEANPL